MFRVSIFEFRVYNRGMARILPITFLILCLSLFGMSWIVIEIDPTVARWYVFTLLVFLIFTSVFCFLGLALYFIRTRFYRRYSARWYVYTSFKMAFFVALFVALVAALAILQMVTTLNITLAILAVSLFAIWSYLGKKN